MIGANNEQTKKLMNAQTGKRTQTATIDSNTNLPWSNKENNFLNTSITCLRVRGPGDFVGNAEVLSSIHGLRNKIYKHLKIL